jgi:hypothetical protein
MLKFLIIIGLILYLVYKIGGFFFRAGAASTQYRTNPRPENNANFDASKKQGKDGTIKGGEYIDYEEVK